MIITLSVIGAVGYLVLATTEGVAPRYTGVFLAAGGIFPVIANILPWVLSTCFSLDFFLYSVDAYAFLRTQIIKVATPSEEQVSRF